MALKPGPRARPREYMERIRRRAARRASPARRFYFQPADIVSQVLNFGLAAPHRRADRGPTWSKALRASRRSCCTSSARSPAPPTCASPRCSTTRPLRLDVDRAARRAARAVTQRDVANNLLISLSSSSLVAPSFWSTPQNNVNYSWRCRRRCGEVDSVPTLLGTPLDAAARRCASGGLHRDLAAGGLPRGRYDLGTVSPLTPADQRRSINHYTVQRVIDVQASVEGRDLGAVAPRHRRRPSPRSASCPEGHRASPLRGQSESMCAVVRAASGSGSSSPSRSSTC